MIWSGWLGEIRGTQDSFKGCGTKGDAFSCELPVLPKPGPGHAASPWTSAPPIPFFMMTAMKLEEEKSLEAVVTYHPNSSKSFLPSPFIFCPQ